MLPIFIYIIEYIHLSLSLFLYIYSSIIEELCRNYLSRAIAIAGTSLRDRFMGYSHSQRSSHSPTVARSHRELYRIVRHVRCFLQSRCTFLLFNIPRWAPIFRFGSAAAGNRWYRTVADI